MSLKGSTAKSGATKAMIPTNNIPIAHAKPRAKPKPIVDIFVAFSMTQFYYKFLITTRVKKISYDETYDGLVTTGHFQQLSLEIEQ